MKSPTELSYKLARQWQQADLRVERLLSPDAWPLEFTIGKPSANNIQHNIRRVQEHVQLWRSVEIGQVIFEPVNYRLTAEAVSLPVLWQINTPSQWALATQDQGILQEYQQLGNMIIGVHSRYRELLIRQRSLWQKKTVDDVIATAKLADNLVPGAAKGRPLRLLGEYGVDTKFIERNYRLLQLFLDERFNGAATEQGLHAFLDASDDNDHWLLVRPLQKGLLPYSRLRLTTRELMAQELPANRILVIENEQCEHLLPELTDTIAVLGAGLDLGWLSAPTLDQKEVIYWGDLDTWGLLMLARARHYRPSIKPLMMNKAVFEQFAEKSAVVEPVHAQAEPPNGLTADEANVYLYLLAAKRGRLEQEFIPAGCVKNELTQLGS